MQFQLINQRGSEKKKARLQTELNNFVSHLQTLTAQSSHLLALLRSLSGQKRAAKGAPTSKQL